MKGLVVAVVVVVVVLLAVLFICLLATVSAQAASKGSVGPCLAAAVGTVDDVVAEPRLTALACKGGARLGAMGGGTFAGNTEDVVLGNHRLSNLFEFSKTFVGCGCT